MPVDAFARTLSGTRQSLGSRDIETIIMQEGENLTAYNEASGTVLTTTTSAAPVTLITNIDNTTAGGASLGGIGPGRMWWVDNFTIGFVGLPSGTMISWQLAGYGDNDGKFPQFVLRGTFFAGGPACVVPVRQFFRPSRTDKSGLVLSVRNVSPALGSNTTVTGVVTGIGAELTDDPNFGASKTLAVFGDSLNYGKGYGPTLTQDMYAFKIRDYYKSQGNNMRIVSFSQPGRTSSMFEQRDRGAGKLDFLQPSVGVYALGTNDAILAAGGFDTTWASNFQTFWNWWSGRYPNVPLLVITPGPLQLTADFNNATTLRTAMAAKVAAIGSNLCKLIDISAAFTRTDTSYYRSSDNVHWNTLGHAAVYSSIIANANFLAVSPQ